MIIESTNNRIKIPYKLEILVLYIELYFASMNAGDIVKKIHDDNNQRSKFVRT